MTPDLGRMLTWLRRQVESDKAKAEKATPGPWRPEYYGGECDEWMIKSPISTAEIMPSGDVAGPGYEGGGVWDQVNAEHIATHDPRDVIADCDAKLKLIDSYEELTASPLRIADAGLNLQWEVLRKVLETLAEGYRHRDGYKSWTA